MFPCRLRCVIALAALVYVLEAVVGYHGLVRIPLESDDQLRFTGTVHLGSPPRSVRVIFDTGSSDMWVTSHHFPDDEKASKAFVIGYGGGIASGFAVPASLHLGSNTSGVHLRDAPVGFVDDQTLIMEGIDAQGVVGLGMEALAQIRGNSSLPGMMVEQQVLTRPVAFSIYISSWPGAQPPSQFILGGDEPALTNRNATWFTFPVISNDVLRGHTPPIGSATKSFGFWALRLHSIRVDNKVLPLGPDSHKGAALLDSGTSMILFPQYAFNAVVQALLVRFGTRFLSPRGGHQTLPACRCCQVHEFPPLAFDLLLEDSRKLGTSSQRFVLQGSDYVRCDQRRRECTALIDCIQSSEISDHLHITVLGTVFLRSYYARFDYSSKQVALACTVDEHGTCPGGFQPTLDLRGRPYESYGEGVPIDRYMTAICTAITALALLVGLRMVLESYEQKLHHFDD
ncbi:hypothetical protein ON010_g4454 [Phytophthora cinnamomi]|nr:hypothetical protein ON010_g4454 [Phytophthora cinnamomi]